MNSRALASIALGAAVLLGATGCSMISPQATTIAYPAAEGVNVPDSTGPVQVRNVFFLVGDGDTANLVGAFVNASNEDQVATLSIEDGPDVTIEVPAGETVSYGVDDHKSVEDFTGELGGNVTVAFTSGNGQTESVEVPVLDGAMDYLKDAAPLSSEPTDEETPAPEASETPSH